MTTPSGRKEYPKIEDNKNGTVTVRYQPREVGLHQLDMAYNGTPIAGSPFQFHVDNIHSGNVTAYGPGLSHGIAGQPATFTIVTKDAGAGKSGVISDLIPGSLLKPLALWKTTLIFVAFRWSISDHEHLTPIWETYTGIWLKNDIPYFLYRLRLGKSSRARSCTLLIFCCPAWKILVNIRKTSRTSSRASVGESFNCPLTQRYGTLVNLKPYVPTIHNDCHCG